MPRYPQTVPGDQYALTPMSRVLNAAAKAFRRSRLAPSHRGYNLTISHHARFVWFRVAKTGTRSFLHALRLNDVKLDAEHAMGVHYQPRRYGEYFKFAFVRNPWDRLVSCWHNKIIDQNWWKLSDERRQHYSHFPHFVDYVSTLDLDHCDVHLLRQSAVVYLNYVDYVGRFESIAKDMPFVLEKLGLVVDPLPKLNASKSRADYQTYYDDRLAGRVHDLYRRDISIFDYQF